MTHFEQAVLLFHKGGMVMYPLLVCSIATVAVIIERYLVFRRTTAGMEVWLPPFERAFTADDWDGVRQLSTSQPDLIPSTLIQCLDMPPADLAHLEHLLERMAVQQVASLRQRLSYLDTIVTLAPLLGLLGTVVGMIHSFSVLSLKVGQPLAITGGVGEALVATAAGLCVAIMALAGHSYFSQQIETIITRLEDAANSLIGAAMKRRNRHEA